MPFVAPMSRATLGAAAAVLVLIVAAAAQDDDILFERDTPYIPSPPDVVARMLDFADVRPGEILVDLGSGDGRIPIAAAQRGARAFGVDLKPELVEQSNLNAAKAGVAGRATFEVKNLFDTDISQADVVTTYLLPLVNLDIRPRLLEQMKPGARLVTHAFHMGEWWPDSTENFRDRVLFKWIIPAKVGGRWQVTSADGDFLMDVEQTFQTFAAMTHHERRLLPQVVAAHSAPIRDGRLTGTEIRFAIDMGVGPRIFHGRVDGDTIHGILPQGWKAVRVKR